MDIQRFSPTLDRLLAPDAELERIATGFRFTEGPLWDPLGGALLFSDIPANRIYRWMERDGAAVYREPSGKSNGLTWDLTGNLLACEHAGRRVSRTPPSGEPEPLVETYGGSRLNSPNDIVVHSSGRIYFTDPPYGLTERMGAVADQEQPVNGLYMLHPGVREPVLLADDFDRPNGLAFSPDERRIYVADTPRVHLRLFDVRDDGTLTGGSVCTQLAEDQGEGRPDGMKLDQLGNIWTTGPGGVWILDRDGSPIAHLRFPERTANCAWGDRDYRSLYVTASTSVYRLRTLVPGLPPRARR